MVRSIVIPHNTDCGPFLTEFAELGDFQQAVGGWLEPLELPALGVTVYMNESAQRDRRLLNTRATALWWLYSARPTDRPLILGNVVLTGGDDQTGSNDVPEPVIQQIFVRNEFVVQVHPRNQKAWFDSFARFDNIFDAAMWCLLFEATMRLGADFRVSGEPPIDFGADEPSTGGELRW